MRSRYSVNAGTASPSLLGGLRPESRPGWDHRPFSPGPEALVFFPGSRMTRSCKQEVVEAPPPLGRWRQKSSFSSPSSPAQFGRLGQQHEPAQVTSNHLITRGLLSLKQFNWTAARYSIAPAGSISWRIPAAADRGSLSLKPAPFPGALQASKASLGPLGRWETAKKLPEDLQVRGSEDYTGLAMETSQS